MGQLSPDARCLEAIVVAQHRCGPDAFILEVNLPHEIPELNPGRFAMLSPADMRPECGDGPLIPRPFSIYDQLGPQRLSFLIQVIGAGTRALQALRIGDPVVCTVPLGNGFEVLPPDRDLVMVAGGVGSAPFLLYARQRIKEGARANTRYLFGARSADRLYDRDAFAEIGVTTELVTEDGTLGFRGNVIECLEAGLEAGRIAGDALFAACGPEGLLHAFASFARDRQLDCELSLETYMGCGFGVCNGCPIETQLQGPLGDWPNTKSCLDGPVYPLAAIAF